MALSNQQILNVIRNRNAVDGVRTIPAVGNTLSATAIPSTRPAPTVVQTAQGNAMLVSQPNTAVQYSLLNQSARLNQVSLTYDTNDTLSDWLEAILTAYMVGQNLNITSVDGTNPGEKLLSMQFSMYSNLNSTVHSLAGRSTMTEPIDTGRVFDIVQLPYSVEDALVVLLCENPTPDQSILKDMKQSIKIKLSSGFSTPNLNIKGFIGRCKTTLTDAYTPFSGISGKFAIMYVDEVETLKINS